MRKLGIIAAIAVALYAAYAFAFPTATVRYRLALSVEADGAEHTGSGVIQVTYGKNMTIGAARELYTEVKGEAVAVEIPARGALFALLKAGADDRFSPERIVLEAFGFPRRVWGPSLSAALAKVRALTGRVELAPGDLPLLVRFRDINDPRTVERVDANDLAASFGPGVYLKRATIEITRDPVTTGIEKRLAWLGPLRSRGASLDGDKSVARSSNALATYLAPEVFRRACADEGPCSAPAGAHLQRMNCGARRRC